MLFWPLAYMTILSRPSSLLLKKHFIIRMYSGFNYKTFKGEQIYNNSC